MTAETLPQNIEAEQALLGSCLIDTYAIEQVAGVLQPADFYLPQNGNVFAAMLDLHESGRPTDVVAVLDQMGKKNTRETETSSYIASLVTITPSSLNAVHYAKITHRMAVLRSLIDAGTAIVNLGHDDTLEADAAVERAQGMLSGIEASKSGDPVKLSDLLPGVTETMEQVKLSDRPFTGLTTGLRDLDRLTSGMQNGDLVILAARPSMGKTACALNMAMAAVKGGTPVLFFSLEMGAEALVQRVIAIESGVDSTVIRTGTNRAGGRGTESDYLRIRDAVENMGWWELYIDTTPSLSVTQLLATAARWKRKHDIGLIVVDYLQLMSPPRSNGNRVSEVSAISRTLKEVARKLNVPLLALAQLSRAPEQRPNHEPLLSDLKESGSIEQDADLVWFIYRDSVYDPETPYPNIADLIVAKHRNGPTGTVHTFFDEPTNRFLDLKLEDNRAVA